MAKVSAMPAVTAGDVVDADEFYILDGGVSKKISAVNLAQISQITSRYVAQSTLTTDGDVLTRASGSPARITRADLAQDTAFSSRYVSQADEEYRWLGVGALEGRNGSTLADFTGTTYGNGGGWALDASSTEWVIGSAILPDYWTTFKVELYWANAASSSGDVVYNARGQFAGDNESADGNTALSSARAIAAPTTAGILEVSQFPSASNVTNVAGKPFWISLNRAGADPSDTLANDVIINGILLTRVS